MLLIATQCYLNFNFELEIFFQNSQNLLLKNRNGFRNAVLSIGDESNEKTIIQLILMQAVVYFGVMFVLISYVVNQIFRCVFSRDSITGAIRGLKREGIRKFSFLILLQIPLLIPLLLLMYAPSPFNITYWASSADLIALQMVGIYAIFLSFYCMFLFQGAITGISVIFRLLIKKGRRTQIQLNR